jgi:hypothetical protein
MIPAGMILTIHVGRGFAYDHSQELYSHFR